MLDVALFGRLSLTYDGENLRFAARPRVAPLLAYLLLNRHQPVARDTVAFALWPDDSEEGARANLRRHLHYLRELLPSSRVPWLVADAHTVRWNPVAAIRLDVAEFERCVRDPSEMQKAVELYEELIPGYDDQWLIEARERLRRTYVAALWELATRARSRRDCSAASSYLELILADDPWREDALRALMLVRCEGGDRSSALQLCAQFEQRLRGEMGVALMPETAALRHAIERGNPLPAIPSGTSPVAPRASSDFSFEGRSHEIGRLRELWQGALASSGAFALVVGEAGIGKTRLASEFALHVESSGGRVLWGATSAPETAPYQAITEVLRAALGFIESLELEEYDLGLLARLVPELGCKEPLAGIDDEPAVAKLFDLIASVLRRLAGQRPALVVLEDLHNAGPASIAMLQHVVEHGLHYPILILATSREEESRSAEALGRLRRPLHGSETIVVPLGALSKADVASIIAESTAPTNAADRVAALAGGHPLFLTQLLYAATDAQGAAARELPARLHDVIAERTARLSPDAGFLLHAASAVGNSFDLEIVGEILGWTEERLADAADELVARRIVRQTANSRFFEYEFSHDLIGSATYESLTERQRRRWHRRTAHAAERWYASRIGELSAFVARHFELGGEREAAASYYLLTARTASAAFANEEALAYARRALGLKASAPAERFELLCIAEEALGRIGERDTQRATLRELDSLARRLGDRERMLEVLRRREFVHRYLGENLAARRVVARLRRLSAGNPRWEAIALRDQATLLMDFGSQHEAYQSVRLAAERAAIADDPAVLVSTLTLQAHVAAALGRRDETKRCLQAAKDFAGPTGSHVLLMRVLYCEMTSLTRFQAWPKVVETGSQLLDVAARVGNVEVIAATHSMLGGALGTLFEIADARRNLREAIELYRRTDAVGLLAAYNNLASIELEVGRLDNTAVALEGMEEVLTGCDSAFGRACARLVACELAAQRGDYTAAIELAEEAVAAAGSAGDEVFAGEALRCKGASLRAIGRNAEAVSALEAALEVFGRLGLDAGTKRTAAELTLASALAGELRAVALAEGNLALCDSSVSDDESPLVLWPLAQAFDALGCGAQAQATLSRAFAAFRTRRKRLHDRRDRHAFSTTPANAALQRACEETPRVRRVPKTRTARRFRPPVHSP